MMRCNVVNGCNLTALPSAYLHPTENIIIRKKLRDVSLTFREMNSC